nr:hypothetical protein Iba_chr09bCG11700 [Ipomoea batatas]GME05146.1 hypothetical protein Iba_scaffold2471.2CG0350 [Ipomoea batatas]
MKGRGPAPLPRRASPPFATPPPLVLCTTPTTAACNSDSRRCRRYQKFQCRPDLKSSGWSTTALPEAGYCLAVGKSAASNPAPPATASSSVLEHHQENSNQAIRMLGPPANKNPAIAAD